MTAGIYLIRITKALAYLPDHQRIQEARFDPDMGKAGRFFVKVGCIGRSIAPSSVEIIKPITQVDKPTMNWKDEGDFYTSKLLPDGTIPKDGELYEYGTLVEFTAHSKKEARAIAAAKGFNATFDF